MDQQKPFEPTFLFHRERGSRLVTSWEEWMVLEEQGGWVESPAEFGVITAPSQDQRFLQEVQAAQGPVVSVPSGTDMREQIAGLHALLGRMQQQIDSLSAAMKTVLEASAQVVPEVEGRHGRLSRER